jgi:hypothetical protein
MTILPSLEVSLRVSSVRSPHITGTGGSQIRRAEPSGTKNFNLALSPTTESKYVFTD